MKASSKVTKVVKPQRGEYLLPMQLWFTGKRWELVPIDPNVRRVVMRPPTFRQKILSLVQELESDGPLDQDTRRSAGALLWGLADTPTALKIIERRMQSTGGRHRVNHVLRDRHIAYEVERLRSAVGAESAKTLVAKKFAVGRPSVERALKDHGAEASEHVGAYVDNLLRLGKIHPSESAP